MMMIKKKDWKNIGVLKGMNDMKRWILIGALCVGMILSVTACGNQSEQIEVQAGEQQTKDKKNKELLTNENLNTEQGENQMIVTVNGQEFQVELYENDTVSALKEKLPMTLSMDELHGNEKYHYLDESLPVNTENIGLIQSGDVMLYGSDCLVVFFENFNTSYDYTRIGHITNEKAFEAALGSGTVEITFSLK